MDENLKEYSEQIYRKFRGLRRCIPPRDVEEDMLRRMEPRIPPQRRLVPIYGLPIPMVCPIYGPSSKWQIIGHDLFFDKRAYYLYNDSHPIPDDMDCLEYDNAEPMPELPNIEDHDAYIRYKKHDSSDMGKPLSFHVVDTDYINDGWDIEEVEIREEEVDNDMPEESDNGSAIEDGELSEEDVEEEDESLGENAVESEDWCEIYVVELREEDVDDDDESVGEAAVESEGGSEIYDVELREDDADDYNDEEEATLESEEKKVPRDEGDGWMYGLLGVYSREH